MFILRQSSVKMAVLLHKQAKVSYSLSETVHTIQFQINVPGTFFNFWCVVWGVRSYLEGVRLLNFDHLVLIVICSNYRSPAAAVFYTF